MDASLLQETEGSNRGGWKAAYFVIAAEFAERFAFYGFFANLITYLTGPLHQSTAAAAMNVNAFAGSAHMLPLVGAFVGDSFLGRYRTVLYFISLCAVILASSRANICGGAESNSACDTSPAQLIFFFTALCLIAIAVSGHKPCLQAFGADQFNRGGSNESKSKSSFFNWWYCGLNAGTVLSYLTMSYIQENLSWSLGIGAIPCVSMVIALLAFLLGTKAYYSSTTVKENGPNPFARIARVFVAAARNWRINSSSINVQEDMMKTSSRTCPQQFKFLDKALVPSSNAKETTQCISRAEVDEAKKVLRLIPIWSTCLTYAIAYSQCPTFFTKQGSTMDRSIKPNFQIPAASLQAFTTLSVSLCMPIYDCIFVPITRALTGRPSGVTALQRVGYGMCISVISMIVAALIERKRLETAINYGLVDMPDEVIPMTVWWLLPQYIIMGVSRAFTMVGLQEFFYDQVPNGMRSLGIALYMSVFGVGSFLSGVLVSIIEKVTNAYGTQSWFPNNLNKGHLDYFYWLLVGLSLLEMIVYMYFAKSYVYSRSESEQ